MRQVICNLKTGEIEVINVPTPNPSSSQVLVKTSLSLISAGTELMMLDFAKSSLLGKARGQKERVKQVLAKLQTEGLYSTWDSVNKKLDQPLALGYSSVGVVIEVGEDVDEFAVGDRVVTNGPHADYVSVSRRLCAKIGNLSDETGVFSIIGAIAVNACRQGALEFGQDVLVIGAGLVGALTALVAVNCGCNVTVLDANGIRCDLVRSVLGLKALEANPRLSVSSQVGVDTFDVAMLAAGGRDAQLLTQAVEAVRRRGKVVILGTTEIVVSRDLAYEKEVEISVSRAYGPGRYDPGYEVAGVDYPFPYVRWTAQRNISAFAKICETRSIDLSPLISKKYHLEESVRAYDELLRNRDKFFGIAFTFDSVASATNNLNKKNSVVINLDFDSEKFEASQGVGIIGSGQHVAKHLLPHFSKFEDIRFILSTNPVTAVHLGKKYKASMVTSDANEAFETIGCDCVVVASPHNTHASYICKALEYRKAVFVEKPICLNLEELDVIEDAYRASCLVSGLNPRVLVGYNRRGSRLVRIARAALAQANTPKFITIDVVAGDGPCTGWLSDPKMSGGRLIGELCHFVDLGAYLMGINPDEIHVSRSLRIKDSCVTSMRYGEGSVVSINYVSMGSKRLPKERISAHFGDSSLVIDNYRSLKGYGKVGFSNKRLLRQDKGYEYFISAFLKERHSDQIDNSFLDTLALTRMFYHAIEQA